MATKPEDRERAKRAFFVCSRLKLKERGKIEEQAIMRKVSFRDKNLSGDQKKERNEKKKRKKRG
jgi:hypothetical protein